MSKSNSCKVNIRPVEGYILVRRLVRIKDTTDGGIVIPEQIRNQLQMPISRIVEVSEGILQDDGTRRKLPYKNGQLVLLRDEPMPIPNEVDDEFLGLCHWTNVVAVVTGLNTAEYREHTSVAGVALDASKRLAKAEVKTGRGHIVTPGGIQ